jgi:hypothetical protein
MCAFGIDELREHPAEILLLGRHAEKHAFCAHVPVENLDNGNSEAQFDFSRWILVGSRVQRESGFARDKLTPAGRLELAPRVSRRFRWLVDSWSEGSGGLAGDALYVHAPPAEQRVMK